MELGKIYSAHIDSSTQTTWLIDRLSWVHCENKEAYDTLHIRNLFSLYKSKSVNKHFTETACSVSLYIKNYIGDYNNIRPTNQTMTSLKNNHCNKLICADSYKRSIFLDEVTKPFLEDSYDDKGDFFFEKPLMFKAQGSFSHESMGFGDTNQYYIVGVNFGGVRKSEIQF